MNKDNLDKVVKGYVGLALEDIGGYLTGVQKSSIIVSLKEVLNQDEEEALAHYAKTNY